MPELRELARWAAANDESDTKMLELAMDAAVQYLTNAGVQPREDDRLYDLAVYQLAVHYYDNKGVLSDGGEAQLPMGVMSIMHQLRSDPEYQEAQTS